MTHDYLVSLLMEWYASKHYFVQRNIRADDPVGDLGLEILDFVAFDPEKRHAVQVEVHLNWHDWNDWHEDRRRCETNFDAGRRYLPHFLFHGESFGTHFEQFALALRDVGDWRTALKRDSVRVLYVDELVAEMQASLYNEDGPRHSVRPWFPLLQTLQLPAKRR